MGAVVSQKLSEKDHFIVTGAKPTKTVQKFASKHGLRIIRDVVWQEIVATL